MRPALVCLLALLAACGRAPNRDDAPPAAELAPRNAQRPVWGDRAPAPPAPVPASVVRGDCVTPGRTALRGVVRQEVRFGAPNYGEDTLTDRRDTIAVLVLLDSLALCPDSALHKSTEPPLHFNHVTLRHVPREILELRGVETTVFGRLEEAAFAWEQGPILMRVDIVPALRRIPRGSAS